MSRSFDEDPSLDRLFAVLPATEAPIKVKRPETPVWTENKAILIQRYLRLFLFITKHGTYLDGFAGPQSGANPGSWAAQLVLELEPAWMRHFHLFDSEPGQVQNLHTLRNRFADRDVHVHAGDFNAKVHDLLDADLIGEKEATFCLLDQRTFECEWATLEMLARFKSAGLKIELFYFLAESWLNRAFAAAGRQGELQIARWWGSDSFAELRNLKGPERAVMVSERIRNEFEYLSVKPWPIYEREGGSGRTMYYMLHATDHPEAPELMSRAYRQTVAQQPRGEQLSLEGF